MFKAYAKASSKVYLTASARSRFKALGETSFRHFVKKHISELLVEASLNAFSIFFQVSFEDAISREIALCT